MKSAEEVLQSLLTKSKEPLADQFLRWRLWSDWNNVVGRSLADESMPVSFHRGTLYIFVKSSAWMQQMVFYSDAIKEKVNAWVGREWAKKIQFTLDRRSVPRTEEAVSDLKNSLSKTTPNGDGRR